MRQSFALPLHFAIGVFPMACGSKKMASMVSQRRARKAALETAREKS